MTVSAALPGGLGSVDRQHLYGLVVDADFDLHQNRTPESDSWPADVVVTSGPPVEPRDEVPQGRVVLDFVGDGTRWYSAAERPDGGYLLRFHGTCEFALSPGLGAVELAMVHGANPGVGGVLTTGAMLAFQLYLREHTVLHGSAVQVADGALAFIGSSGQGKSTMATLQCADGAALITDDVLRVDTDTAGAPRVRLGATELRLRKGADALAARFAKDRLGERVSADERRILSLPDDAEDKLPLRAMVIPVPDKDGGELRISELPASEALFAILNFGRLNGWADREIVSRHFAQVAELVKTVPVFVAQVPWGPPFGPDLAAQVRMRVLGQDGLR